MSLKFSSRKLSTKCRPFSVAMPLMKQRNIISNISLGSNSYSPCVSVSRMLLKPTNSM